MTPHKQLFLNDPTNGIAGDCYRTCVACLLDVEPSEVPHEHADTGPEMYVRINEWLKNQGLVLIEHWAQTTDLSTALVIVKQIVSWAETHFIIAGISPRETFHAVIANTSGLVHDPHPDDNFIVGPYAGTYYLTFIGRIC